MRRPGLRGYSVFSPIGPLWGRGYPGEFDGRSAPRAEEIGFDVLTAHFEDAASDLRREVAALQRELQAAAAERDEAIAQRAATAEVLEVINASPENLAAVFDAIVERAIRLCGADFGGMWLFENDRVLPVGGRNLPAAYLDYLNRDPPPPSQILGRAARERPYIHILDLVDTDAYRNGLALTVNSVKLGGIRTFLAVPLRDSGSIAGMINLYRQEVRPFTDNQIALVRAFAAQALIAMKNARLFNETRQALERQTATSEILRVISQSPTDARPVFDAIVLAAVRSLHCEGAFVLLREGDGVETVAGTMGQGLLPELPGRVPLDPAHNFPARAILSGQTLHVPDWSVANLPEHERNIQAAFGVNCGLWLPFIREGACIGVIGVGGTRPNQFGPKDIAQAESFRDQAVIAIENARLFNETQEALQRETATSEILSVISRSPTDAQPVFDAIVLAAVRSLRCDAAFVLLREGDAYYAASFATPDGMGEVPPDRLPLDPAANFPSRAILSGEKLYLPDWSKIDVPEHERNIQAAFGINSGLYLPLMREGVCIGVLGVGGYRANSIGPKETAQAESFRDQALIAIENARLFNETQEALARETATSEILRVISQSPTDAQPVFDSICSTAVQSLRCDFAFIMLRDGDAFIHPAGATPEGPLPELPGRTPLDPEANFPSRAILSGEKLYLPDWSKIELPEHERAIRAAFNVDSALYLPLLREDACIGLLAVGGHRADSFGPKDIAQAELFRDQAMIAIENARLFNETQEALERQTATAEILKIIAASPGDPQPVFDAIVESARRLLGAHSATIVRFDGGLSYLQAMTSVDAEADAAARATFPRPAPDRNSSFGARLWADGFAEIADTETELQGGAVTQIRARSVRSLVSVLLKVGGETFGFLTVSRREPGRFSPAQVALLRAFADQAAIAIENARLFNETKEALERQTATAEVLKVISRSVFDLQAVLDALLASAVR